MKITIEHWEFPLSIKNKMTKIPKIYTLKIVKTILTSTVFNVSN